MAKPNDTKLNDWMAKVNEMKNLRANARRPTEAPTPVTPTSQTSSGSSTASAGAGVANARPRSRTFAVEGTPRPTALAAATVASGGGSSPQSQPQPQPQPQPTPSSPSTSSSSTTSSTSTTTSSTGGSSGSSASTLARMRAGTAATPARPSAGVTAGGSTGGGGGTEVEELRRKLSIAEKEKEIAQKELEILKKKREEARNRLKAKHAQLTQAKESSQQRKATGAATGAGATKPATGAGATGSPVPVHVQQQARSTKRMTRAHVVDHIGKLIAEMGNLEQAISSAEEGRIRAENELIEYATEKAKVEENIVGLNNEMEKVTAKVSQLISMVSSNQQAKNIVLAMKENIDACKKLAEASISQNNNGTTTTVEEIKNRRGAMTLNAPPSAPAGPAPPVPMMSTQSSSNVGGEEQMSVLQQIRMGKQLKQVDLNMIRKERAKSSRKSMAVLLSLTDTLRLAMESRNVSIAGNDDDDWEDEEDLDW